jgi:hypothetical protein
MLLVHDEFQRLLTDLESASPAQLATVPADSANLVARAMQGSATFDSRDATLDASIASGTLAVIRDVRLRELLARWKAEVDDLDEESAEFRDAASKARERVATLGGPWIDDPEISLRPPDLAVAAADQELQALLRTKRWVGIVYLDYLNRFVALSDTILDAIEANSPR